MDTPSKNLPPLEEASTDVPFPGRVYIGSDPGKTGALCVTSGRSDLLVFPMPDNRLGILVLVCHLAKAFPNRIALHEEVGGYRGQGGSASFQFGLYNGWIQMALEATSTPFHEVGPKAWQKEMGVPPRRPKGHPEGKESSTRWKHRLFEVAQGLFPDAEWPSHRVTDNRACGDAALLAHLCWLRYRPGGTHDFEAP